MVRKIQRIVCLVGLVAALLPITNYTPTTAAASTHPETTSTEVQLTVDCAATLSTEKGRAAAERKGLCGLGAVPDAYNIVYGSCGAMSLVAGNGVPIGSLLTALGSTVITSIQGSIQSLRFRIYWVNNTNGRQGNEPYLSFPFNNQVRHEFNYLTGKGLVEIEVAELLAIIEDGIVCTGLNPKVEVNIGGDTE
jgi:hypothetical protein